MAAGWSLGDVACWWSLAASVANLREKKQGWGGLERCQAVVLVDGLNGGWTGGGKELWRV